MHYHYMQTVFGCGVATGKFAMGSNEPLGQPAATETIDLEAEGVNSNRDAGHSFTKGKAARINKTKHEESTNARREDNGSGKRKRVLNEDDAALLHGMTEAVVGLSSAIKEGNHSEAAPGIYDAVMTCPNFARSDLMICLNYLMQNKASALVFVGMTAEDKELWISTHLAKVKSQMAFQ